MWGVWNPSKVLPETLQPLCGYIAAFIVYPITGDYVASIALTQSIIISVCIAVFFWISFIYFKEKFSLSLGFALCIELIFFLSFFLAFKQKNGNSFYGFWSPNLTCYFNYIIPGLLNASVIMWLSKSSNHMQVYCDRTCQAVFIICIYLALFSNIQSSILISGYCFIKLAEVLVKNFIENKKLFNSKEIWVYVAIELLWLVSLLFEASGLRAMGLTKNTTSFFTIPISKVLDQYSLLLSHFGKYYAYLFFIFGTLAWVILLIDKNIRKKIYCSYNKNCFTVFFSHVVSDAHTCKSRTFVRKPSRRYVAGRIFGTFIIQHFYCGCFY